MVRYLGKVDQSAGPDACWPWTGATDQDGYGIFWDGTYRESGAGHYVRVTRWTYEQFVAPIPDGRQLLHSCDNPPCVNIAHLSVGTCADNHAERETRGRGVRQHGEAHPGSKLTASDVRAIRRDYAQGALSMVALGRLYGVSAPLIHKIVHRKTWAHID